MKKSLATLSATAVLAASALLSAPAASAAGLTGIGDPRCDDTGFACTTGGYSAADSGTWAESRFGVRAGWSGFDGHNCTRYAAFKLARNGVADFVPTTERWGNAAAWDTTVSTHLGADRVNRTPAVGAIAQWDGDSGHVAYVEAVQGNLVRITEDSWGGGTRARTIDISQDAGVEFLHVRVVPATPSSLQVSWYGHSGQALDIAFATVQGGWELFHLGTNNVIYRKVLRNGGSTGWLAIEGPRAKRIAATTSTDGRVELFYIGMNDQVYHHWESTPGGSIANWEGLGGYATEIAAARGGTGWEVFHVGGGNSIWRATQAKRTWANVPGQVSNLSAATSTDGRVELFATGLNGHVYHAWQATPGGSLGGWYDHGGDMRQVGATSVGNGNWEVFAVDAAGKIWRLAPYSGVDRWQAMNGWATDIAPAKSPDGRVEVAHIGGGRSIWHAWQRSAGLF